MSEAAVAATPGFVETKEYRRFAEFCDAVRRYRYIGLCYGPPGVGKTLSARRYAQWDLLEPLLVGHRALVTLPPVPAVAACQTLVYTPQMTTTPRLLDQDPRGLRWNLDWLVEAARHPETEVDFSQPRSDATALVVVDEADRLKMATLEQLRDVYDRGNSAWC